LRKAVLQSRRRRGKEKRMKGAMRFLFSCVVTFAPWPATAGESLGSTFNLCCVLCAPATAVRLRCDCGTAIASLFSEFSFSVLVDGRLPSYRNPPGWRSPSGRSFLRSRTNHVIWPPSKRKSQCSSVVEQRFRKPQVSGSNPDTGSSVSL
jgi:hypothetical protein